MEDRIKKQLLELVAMLHGGYTTDLDQLRRLLGIQTKEEEKWFMFYIDNLDMIGSIEVWDEGRVYIV